MPRRRGLDADNIQSQVIGVGYRADRHQRMRTPDFPPVRGTNQHSAIIGAYHGIDASVLFQGHTTLGQHRLQHVGGISVIVRENAVTRRHHRDRNAKLSKGGHKLRAGHAGPHHDQMFRQLINLIHLPPCENALPVRLRTGQNPWRRPCCYQHQITFDGLLAAIRMRNLNVVRDLLGVVVVKTSPTVNHTNASAVHLCTNIRCLGLRQRLNASIDSLKFKKFPRDLRALETHVVDAAEIRSNPRCGNKRLRGDTVVNDRRTPKPLVLHQGNVGPILCAGKCGFVSGWAAADNNYSLGHKVSSAGLLRGGGVRITQDSVMHTPCFSLSAGIFLHNGRKKPNAHVDASFVYVQVSLVKVFRLTLPRPAPQSGHRTRDMFEIPGEILTPG